jgi:hypothetical protein
VPLQLRGFVTCALCAEAIWEGSHLGEMGAEFTSHFTLRSRHPSKLGWLKCIRFFFFLFCKFYAVTCL